MVQKMDKGQNDVGMSLIETIISPELQDVMTDFGEIALDSIMKDGILKDVPVIGSIVGFSKAAISIRDKLLVQKILYFLRELSDTTEEERKNFLQGFEDNPREQRRVGENLMLLLDRLDDLDKPAMIARLLKAYVKGDIGNYDEFIYYSSVVDRMLMIDLSALLLNFSQGAIGGFDEDWFGKRFHHLGLSFMDITVNPKFHPEPENSLDRIKYRVQQKRSPTDNAIVKFRLSESAYILVAILLGDAYRGGEYPLDSQR
jgi:hypothetical protein